VAAARTTTGRGPCAGMTLDGIRRQRVAGSRGRIGATGSAGTVAGSVELKPCL
jgi:hypothetical protein